MVGAMRAEHTRYEVPGWGAGDLWTTGDLVLAHELSFAMAARLEPGAQLETAAPPEPRETAAPPMGAHGPPGETLSGNRSRVGDGLVPKELRLRPAAPPGFAGDLVRRFLAFFAGEDPCLGEVAIDLDWATPFERAVATTLRGVPRGEVVSYGELAALAGHPRAGRAVGTFCAGNRFMLLVPCHRVVGASGIGGYGSAGIGVKRRLLALEGVTL
jgi:methylated-DNA-[protein]-cysteine S-methyltransferase